MASVIPIPDSAFSEQSLSLSNEIVTITFKFNHVNNSWYLDLRDFNDEEIISGIKVVPNQNLTARYYLEKLPNGSLWCFFNRRATEPLGRDNFGKNKDYILVWVSKKESESIGLRENVIQI